MKDSLEFLKYPIGKFVMPKTNTKSQRSAWINAIKVLPLSLRNEIATWSAEQFNTPYREGGWTVKQLIHHIADSHMNSIIRFKLGLTEDNPTIKPYDQDKWVDLADVKELDASVSLGIIDGVHLRLVCLLNNMTDADFKKTIFHPEMKKSLSLGNLLALYGWHSAHHLAHITELKKRNNW
jgi:uncharacterized damage-inducible protein DinB